MPAQLYLSTALDGVRGDPAPASLWSALLALAEEGGFDFVTLADSFAPPADGEEGRLEALAVLARTAPLTRRIGLVPTVTTTHTEPFHAAMELATLDYVSEGRAGWLVDVSTTAAEAAAFGRRGVAPPERLWSEAADAAEVAARLWDSWEDDAEIRDAATGRFIDRERLHYVDFAGPHFSVRGPSIVPRPPQGRPPVVVSLAAEDPDERGELAVRYADVVLLDAAAPGEGRQASAVLRDRARDAGRPLRTLVRVAVDLTGAAPRSVAPGGALAFTGSVSELAELLGEWQEAGAADGFHFLPSLPEEDLPPLTRELLPALHRRGLLPSDRPDEGAGGTLRDRLGLERPVSRYATEVPR